MKLFFSPRSPFVRKALVAVYELGLAASVELVPVIVRMDTPHAELLTHNPLGKIPTLLTDDGQALYDSYVIIDHLDRKCGQRLIPATGPDRDWVLLTHALAHGLMEVTVLWRNERDKPVAQQTPGWLENFQAKTMAALARMEADVDALTQRSFGLGHIATAVVLSYLDYRFADLDWRSRAPRLALWHEAAEARPSMRATRISG